MNLARVNLSWHVWKVFDTSCLLPWPFPVKTTQNPRTFLLYRLTSFLSLLPDPFGLVFLHVLITQFDYHLIPHAFTIVQPVFWFVDMGKIESKMGFTYLAICRTWLYQRLWLNLKKILPFKVSSRWSYWLVGRT